MKPLQKKVTQTMYAHIDQFREEGVELMGSDMTKYGYTMIGKVSVTWYVPQITDAELVNKKLDYLQQGREETVKEFTTKLANIDRSIEELRALPAPGDV